MVYFEGGEPFLFYPILLQGLREARERGYRRGIVSNAFWATSVEDAVEWLRPIAEIGVSDLSLSSDFFHGEAMLTQAARNAVEAADRLGLPHGTLSVEAPEGCSTSAQQEKGEPISGGAVRFRGRAAAKLIEGVPRRPWSDFDECPDEDFADPGRIHVDAYGHAHLCQGLLMGNLWHQPLQELVASYEPAAHPIIGPLLEGGPAELARRSRVKVEAAYTDACHLCYSVRDRLRSQYPEFLGPSTVYGDL
jgi:hypothetical protein